MLFRSFQRSDLSLPVIERLSRIANVRYIKDASFNIAACIKGGLELQGYAVGAPLPPQAPLSADGIEDVRRALASIGAL